MFRICLYLALCAVVVYVGSLAIGRAVDAYQDRIDARLACLQSGAYDPATCGGNTP